MGRSRFPRIPAGFTVCGGTPVLGDHLQVAIGPDDRVHVAWATEDRDIFCGVAESG